MKKIVHYLPLVEGEYIRVGYNAIVTPIDHSGPFVSNNKPVITSKVIRHNEETGEFETENTIYLPLKDDI